MAGGRNTGHAVHLLDLNFDVSWAVYHTIDSHLEVHHMIMLPIQEERTERILDYSGYQIISSNGGALSFLAVRKK